MSATFQALTWEARDIDDQHIVSIFGRTENGQSVCVSTEFKPYFYVKATGNPTELFKKIREAAPSVVSYSLVKAKDLWGFQNGEMHTFMRLNFKTLAGLKKCDYALRRSLPGLSFPLRLYEANIEPVLRLMHKTGISSTGWLSTGACVPGMYAKTDVDLFQNDWKELKPVKRDDLAPFIIASFDIETNSSTGKFPDATIVGDSVFQIAVTLKKQGGPVYEKVCLCYKETEGPDVISFKTEKELLEGFQKYLEKKDVDVITGWNIFGFDLEFIYKRAMLVGASQKFFQLSKLRNFHCEMTYKRLSSSALGDNELKLLPMPGRFIFDLFHEVKREKKLDSYSLNAVSQKYLGDQKLDMPPKEMFRRFREEDPKELGEVAEYCVKDTLLPHALMDKLFTFLNLVEMAKATWVPLCYLAERGQQIKVFSQLTKKARELNFMVPVIRFDKKNPPAEGYQGATVLKAQTGAYYVPITTLDFESLYPSIMMAHNLCYSSLVMNPKYDNLPGVTYEEFQGHRFAQGTVSLLPSILDELKVFRKQAKKDMAIAKAAGDVTMEKIYDGKQLAFKVSMNSVYGFTGAGKGMLPCLPIASTVTTQGRYMIETTKNFVEATFPGAIVRYGDTDSVMIEFDVQGRTGIEAIEYSWNLGKEASKGCNGLFKKPNNIELEKVYYPYILYSAKRYAAKMWVQNKAGQMVMDKIDIKGLQTVRRDTTHFVRDTCSEILNVILESNNGAEAVNIAKRRAVELLDGRVQMEKLVLSQKLGDSYDTDNYPHVTVRNKMREREPGSEPQSGDRVPYVLVQSSGDKQFEKAEDPKWAAEHGVQLDYRYYFTNKFMNPVSDLLEPLVDRNSVFSELFTTKKKFCYDPKQRKLSDYFQKRSEPEHCVLESTCSPRLEDTRAHLETR